MAAPFVKVFSQLKNSKFVFCWRDLCHFAESNFYYINQKIKFEFCQGCSAILSNSDGLCSTCWDHAFFEPATEFSHELGFKCKSLTLWTPNANLPLSNLLALLKYDSGSKPILRMGVEFSALAEMSPMTSCQTQLANMRKTHKVFNKGSQCQNGFYIFIPIPSSKSRNPYFINHALTLAKNVRQHLGGHVLDILTVHSAGPRENNSQKKRSLQQRKINGSNIEVRFTSPDQSEYFTRSEARIVLVDDIVTTGNTAKSAINALKAFLTPDQLRNIQVWTIAYRTLMQNDKSDRRDMNGR